MEKSLDELPQKPTTRKRRIEKKDAEMLDVEIDLEMNELDMLIMELEEEFDFFASENNLSGEEEAKQRKKVLGSFEDAIKKLKKRKDSELKLAKIKEIKKEIEKRIKGDIFGENEEFIATKGGEELKLKAENAESPTNLGDDSGEIYGIEAAKAKENTVIEQGEEFPVEKNVEYKNGEPSFISEKAIKDKDFAYDLMEHEINKKLKKENADFAKEIAEDIESFRKGLIFIFDKLRDKFAEFKKNIADSEDDKSFSEKLEGTINAYARRIREFDTIDTYDTKTLTKINQLHHEMQEWADRDWVELYGKKKGLDISKKEVETVLHDLDDKDLHGEHGVLSGKVRDIEVARKIIELEDQYGVAGTAYTRYDKKTGFPVDSFEIVDYELGKDEKNTFVIIKKIVDDKETEIRIDLMKFKKDKRYIKSTERIGDAKISEGEEPNGENLSEEERMELVALLGEKLSEVESDYDLLMKKFHDFREKNKEEIAYNKIIFKKTLDIHEKKALLRKIVKEDVNFNQELLNSLIDLDKDIINLIEANWDKELKEFKREIDFSEKDSLIIEKSKEIVNKFIKDSEAKFDWENFPKGRKDVALEIQAVAFLLREFKKRKLFIDKEEAVAEFIVKNRSS